MKTILLILSLLLFAQADNTNVSLNYSSDFGEYAEIESTQFYDWGTFYGFANIGTEGLFTTKPTLDIDIVGDLNFHVHDFYLQDKGYHMNQFVVGASYDIVNGNFFLQPFLGLNYQNDTYFNDMNGMMTGWVFDYKFKINEENFKFNSWHECAFNRDSDGGDGHQGALQFWWHINQKFTTGVRYRYFKNDGGFDRYKADAIYVLRYNL